MKKLYTSLLNIVVAVVALALPSVARSEAPAGFKAYEYSDVTVDPKQGAVTELLSFNFWFHDFSWGADYNASKTITLVNDATGQVVASGKPADALSGSNADGSVALDSRITEPGSYTLIVPEGAFYDLLTDDDCPEYKFAYYIEGSQGVETPEEPVQPGEFKPYEYDDVAVKPAQGTYGILQHFDFELDLFLVDGNATKLITFVNDATGEVVASAPGKGGSGLNDGYVEFAEPITAAGHYTLVVPAGAFYDVYDDENPEYKFAYILDGTGSGVVEEPEYVTATPADGATVTKLDKIELAFDIDFDTYPISPAYHDPKGPIVAKNAAGEQVATGTVDRGSEAHIMVLTLSEAITEPGEYTVEVPARNIILEGTDETRYNRSFTLAYKVEPFKPIENKGVSIKPAQGEVSALTAFTISFEDIQFVEVNGNFKARLISKASGEEVASAKVRYGARTWDADVELDTPVTEAGEYVLVCEENLFYDGMTDEDFPEYRFAYVVDGSGVIPYEPEVIYSDPEENVAVGQLDEIVLTFDNIDQAYQNREVLAGISALDASGNAVAACAFFYDPNTMSGNEIGIRLSEPVTASGTYTITLPRRAFTLGGNMSDARFSNATTLTYLVDSSLSIGSVAVDADVEVRYFDLQGRSLAAPARGQVVIRVAGGKASKIRY